MTSNELKALCESVGRKLTMRPVRVRFQQPAYENAVGTACRRGSVAVVDIIPGLTGEKFLIVFLHELGHVKTLWGSWTVEVPDFQPGSLRVPEIYDTSRALNVTEQEAERLACEWREYAEKYADRHSGSWLEKRLKALECYLEPEMAELNEMVEQAVKRVQVERERERAELVNSAVESALKRVQVRFEKGR